MMINILSDIVFLSLGDGHNVQGLIVDLCPVRETVVKLIAEAEVRLPGVILLYLALYLGLPGRLRGIEVAV